ncbi:MAG: 50S ribosomal protein L24 [Patescibacteria group bacterium]
MKIKKGDKVKIMLGKDRGKTGEVKFVLGKEKRLFVEGVNVYKRHVRKVGDTKGGILDIPKSLDVSNVALLCPSCKKPTRVGFKIMGKEKLRICKKCKKEIKDAKT